VILYLSQGANPRIVQLLLQEKRLSLEIRDIDLAAGEHRSDAFLCKNALGQLPVLELDNGQCISQTTAICEYLEELHPTPPLIGATAEERAETRMWLRRLDFLITVPSPIAFPTPQRISGSLSTATCIGWPVRWRAASGCAAIASAWRISNCSVSSTLAAIGGSRAHRNPASSQRGSSAPGGDCATRSTSRRSDKPNRMNQRKTTP